MKKNNYPWHCKCFLLLLLVALIFPSNGQSQTIDSFSDDNHDWVPEGCIPQSLHSTPAVYMNPKDTGDVIHTIPTQTSYWQGMTWDGNFLWCSEILLGKIHQVDPAFGTVIKTLDAPGTMIEGLAWDGANLWAMENGNGPNQPSTLYKLDPEDGSVIDSFDDPYGVWIHGITYDGQYLWMVDFAENLIYKVNPATGDVVHSINTPGIGSIGLTWDGVHLWTDDIEEEKLYCLDPNTGAVLFEVTSPHENPRDLAWDGDYLWVMASQSNLIYQVDVGLSTSTDEFSQLNEDQYDFSAYPNPVIDHLTIALNNTIIKRSSVEIINITGQKVFESTLSNQLSSLDLGFLPKGQYFIRLRMATHEVESFKFIKK